MAFIKLDDSHQNLADVAYRDEKEALKSIDVLEGLFGRDRWFSVGRTHIEQGYMALRKGITEDYKKNNPDKI